MTIFTIMALEVKNKTSYNFKMSQLKDDKMLD